MSSRRWTSEEDDLLVTLHERDEKEWKYIAAVLGRTIAACAVRYHGMRRPFRRRRRVHIDDFEPRADHPIRSLQEIAASSNTAPKPELVAERERRLAAREARDAAHVGRGDITSSFFGDPPPGYSALDRKRQAEESV